MAPKNDLFHLIKSMTKAEKRYFILRVNRYTGETTNNNLLLFRAIEKMQDYNESAIKKALKRHTIVKNLSAAKYQLYQLILRCLNDFRAGKSLSMRLTEMIQTIGTLQQRGLYDQAGSLLGKARQLAEKNERFLQLLELLALERSLLENSSSYAFIKSLRAIADREQKVHQQLANYNAYAHLRDRVTVMRKKSISALTAWEKEEIRSILEHPLLCSEQNALSFCARLSFHRIRAEIAVIELRGNDAMAAYQCLTELWEQRPEFAAANARKYRTDLINFLNACFIVQRFDVTESLLQKVKSMTFDLPDDEVKTFQDLAHVELLYCLELGLFERGKAVIADIERGLTRYKGKLSITRSFTLHYNIGLFYFFNDEFSKALEWMHAIVHYRQTDLRQDLRGMARLFLPVIHFELDNVDILDSLLRSAQRHFRQEDLMLGFEHRIISYMNKIIACRPDQRRQYFALLRSELTEFMERTTEKPIPALNEILFWVESKLENVPLKTILLRKIAEAKAKPETA